MFVHDLDSLRRIGRERMHTRLFFADSEMSLALQHINHLLWLCGRSDPVVLAFEAVSDERGSFATKHAVGRPAETR